MKKIMKVAAVLSVALMALAFTGCPNTAGGGDRGKFGKNFDKTNEKGPDDADKYMRGYTTTATAHTGATAKITLKYGDSLTDDGAGVVGFIFRVEENEDDKGKKDGTENFGVIGLRRNKKGQVQYYISHFKNVATDDANLNKTANLCDIDGIDSHEPNSKASENEIVKSWENLKVDNNDVKEGDSNVDIVVYVVLDALDKDGNVVTKDKDGNGDYKVSFYTKGQWTTDGKKPLDNQTPETKILKYADLGGEGEGKTKQYKLGMYTNVYSNSNLKCRFDLLDTVNECEIEFED